MATLASVVGKITAKITDQERFAPQSGRDASTRLRAFANEDIFLFVKHIDNSRVARAVDPDSGRKAWKAIATMVAAVLLVIAVLIPSASGRLAGYQIEKLRLEGEKLTAQRAQLELREAALISPERMLELARDQQFIDPAPDQVVRLDENEQDRVATLKK
jgi:hypothetical protein